jgi:hypothetical protein
MIEFVSQLYSLDRQLIASMAEEILATEISWTENYSKYHSSGWKTVALYNESGKSEQNDLKDCVAIPTELLLKLPTVSKFLSSCAFDYMWVRLLRMEPGTYLWEHTDYGDLEDRPRLRLHLPITTDKEAYIVQPEANVHLSLGYIWKLDPRNARHAAFNAGVSPRIHMVMDCYVNPYLEDLVAKESLDPACVHPLPAFKEEHYQELKQRALIAYGNGEEVTAERLFLTSFHRYDLGEICSYDLLVRFYSELGAQDKEKFWALEKREFLNLDVYSSEARAA